MRVPWLAAASILAACGTTPVPSSSAEPVAEDRIYAIEMTKPQTGYALLVVTRDKGIRAVACLARIYVDGTKVADLRNAEQIRLFVEEGEHIVGVSAEAGVCFGGSDQTSVVVTRAKPVLLRVSAGHGDGMTIVPSPF